MIGNTKQYSRVYDLLRGSLRRLSGNEQYVLGSLLKYNMAEDWSCFTSDFVAVGGGVSGVSCCQYLAENEPNSSITLLAPKDLVKLVTSHKKVTRTLEEVVVEERPSFKLSENYPNIRVINEFVTEICHRSKLG